LNQRNATTPRGKRSRNAPVRQTAWIMMRVGTELGRGFTLMSELPEIVGKALELE
jgi:hypothetical protein